MTKKTPAPESLTDRLWNFFTGSESTESTPQETYYNVSEAIRKGKEQTGSTPDGKKQPGTQS